MDDSDQDFVDLCSKLLKRVRRKPGENKPPKSAEQRPSTQTSEGDKRKKKNKKDGDSGSKVTGTQSVCTGTGQHSASGGTGGDSRDAGSLAVVTSSTSSSTTTTTAAGPRFERGMSAKDKVLLKMQQFKKTSPPRMTHRDTRQQMNLDGPQLRRQGSPEPCSSGLHTNSDEALALRLQQELDREEAQAEMVDLEDGGLFFCQICHRDLSHMTPEGRTQHLNRCLDDSENSAPIPPPPRVLDCPICGKTFKSQKSRSTHLKRCSSEMGVPPAVLLQALQRQAKETPNVPTVNTAAQTGGTKRKGPSKPGLPVKKKPRKKADPLDEDTMVALALSSSLLQREKEAHGESNTEPAASHTAVTTALKWRPDGAAKGRGKKKRTVVPRPPPILLVQDAGVALVRLQERVSALLLRNRAPSPPTPTRCPSRLCGSNGAASLWQKSALLISDSTGLSDFYTPELRELITPWETAKANEASNSAGNKPESSLQPENEGTPVPGSGASILPSSTQTAASTPETGQRLVGSQALRDLMELAEDGMTLTQCRDTASGHAKDKQSSTSQPTNLHLSGFVLEEEEEEGAEEKADLCVSDFLPKTDIRSQSGRKHDRPRGDERGNHRSVAISRLSSDLNSMVNNPQLSDVQLQVDSGEVYFAHSFMVYARCPLLAEMVHESGFGVQEEGVPAAQRVLMSDIPGQAVLALLQYIYTAHCSIPSSLQPHIQELASRFDLQELHQLCELHAEEAPPQGDEADHANQAEDANDQTDQAFMDLLRSMWNEEDEDNEGTDSDGGKDEEEDHHQTDDVTSGERELCEEQVNEEELEEIYNFAATQRKRVEENDSIEEEEEERKFADDEDSFPKLTEPQRGISNVPLNPNSKLKPHPSQDFSYNRLFSESFGVYKEENISPSTSTSGPSKTQTSQRQKQQSSCKPSGELSVRTLLQFSPSIVDDFSPSPPPSTSNLPVAGVSPAQVGDYGGGGDVETEGCRSLKRESQGSRAICVPPSPDSSLKKKEPELIVLSDSSDEMEVDVAVLSSHSLHSPRAVQKLQTFTQIRTQSIPEPSETIMENKVSSSVELSPSDPPDGHPGSGCDSLEVSWLIPSTPVHPGRCNKISSSQSKSSICRTQLFPKGGTSSPSSPFSSPALPSHYSLHNSSSEARVSSKTGPTEISIPRLNLEATVPCSSGLDPNFSPKSARGFGVNKNREMSSVPQHQHKPSHLPSSSRRHPLSASFKQDTPQHVQPQPYSSTPLHTELQLPPVLPATSPLTSSLDKQRTISQGRDSTSSESLETTELGSFHLSPLSNPSDPPSSLSHNKGLHCPQKHNKSLSDSRCPQECSSRTNTGAEFKRKNEDSHNESEQENVKEGGGEPGVVESSFQQSFMDEPPIAFNDSWGLDAYAGADPGCFSLRLEDSGGSSQQEHSLGRGEAAKSSSSDCPPAPSVYHIRSGKSCSTAVQSSPSKTHCAQPPASVQAQRKPSFTSSPPEINNSLMDPKVWDSWEEEDEEVLPLSQRVNPSAQLRTPAASRNKMRRSVVPITPMPHYSDMDTPELKNKLNSFGVRPLPKRQMVLKLREIHQYTHQVVSSDSDDEAPSARRTLQVKPPPKTSSAAASSKSVSCSQTVTFKEPRAPAAVSPLKQKGEEEEEGGELLSASQGSNTSSTAASEESERSNPELCPSTDGDSDSDGGVSASQAATRHQDRLQAVRSFILSDSRLYSQILQYQPLVLSELQGRLKAAGIRLGAAKLVDYLDSQCITFTTAKPGHSAPSRRRGKRTKATLVRGGNGKKAVSGTL